MIVPCPNNGVIRLSGGVTSNTSVTLDGCGPPYQLAQQLAGQGVGVGVLSKLATKTLRVRVVQTTDKPPKTPAPKCYQISDKKPAHSA